MIISGLLFSIALIVHEVGHLLAALAFRVRVSKFCLFFDPWFRLIDTGKLFSMRLCVGWIPFGAYVRFLSAEESTDNHNNLYENLHPLKRVAISLSGVMMNLLMACLFIFAWVGNHADRIHSYSVAKHIAITHRIVNDEIDNVVASISDYRMEGDRHSKVTNDTARPAYHKSTPKMTWNNLLLRFARINLFLFLFNLLPLPPLDGAQTLYHIYEYVFHKPLNIAFQVIAGCIGFAVIMGSNIIELIKYTFTIFG